VLRRTHGFKICGNTPKFGEIRLSQNLQFNAVSIEFTDNSEKKLLGKQIWPVRFSPLNFETLPRSGHDSTAVGGVKMKTQHQTRSTRAA
jgi:hypothetical protein